MVLNSFHWTQSEWILKPLIVFNGSVAWFSESIFSASVGSDVRRGYTISRTRRYLYIAKDVFVPFFFSTPRNSMSFTPNPCTQWRQEYKDASLVVRIVITRENTFTKLEIRPRRLSDSYDLRHSTSAFSNERGSRKHTQYDAPASRHCC